jgi:PAS domain S-box-containing protein
MFKKADGMGFQAFGILRLALPAAILVALLALIASLVIDVRERLKAVEAADSDNGQWVMIQTEVEVLRLQYSLSAANSGTQSLSDVRRWYDVLYSRLNLLEQSPLYAGFVDLPENRERLSRMRSFMDRWVGVIDGTDAELRAALRTMEQENLANQVDARALSLNSLLNFSADTDTTRGQVSDTLMRLAITTLITFLLLGLMAIVLIGLYRTTRRQARENEITGARLQMIIASSPDAIVVTNRGGWVVEFNPEAEAMFGIKRDAIMGQKVVPQIVDPAMYDHFQSVISAAITKAAVDGPQRIEIEALRADGTAFPLEIAVAIRDLKAGSLVVAFMRDVSDRHAADYAVQSALKKAQAGEKAKADFLAVMSHEMRTPLNGLIGSIDLMKRTPLDANQQELLRVLEVSGDILLAHVNSVLDISRAESGEIKLEKVVFDLDLLLGDVIANQSGLAAASGNILETNHLTGPLGFAQGDPGRLRQILLNLIGNAVQFTRNGTITVETERHPGKTPQEQGEFVEFRIIDNGIGIASENQQLVFEDFQTLDASYDRQNSGTGLGLGIARRLTIAMGGNIGLESEVGKGSVFWLNLPLPIANAVSGGEHTALPPIAKPSAAVHHGDADAPDHNGSLQTLDILVIEDNEINRFLLRRFLTDAHHRVTEAADGLEGLAAAMARHFDLIITDISMPRMNGIEATKAIRASHGPSARSRIIALTAHALPEEVERFRKAGMDACLTKPVTREELMSKLYGSAPCESGLSDEDARSDILESSALDELSAELGQNIVTDLIGRMIADGDITLTRLAAFSAPDEDVRKLVHQLSGSCATFGALRLREALATIEAAIKRGDVDTARTQLATLPDLWAKTRVLLAAYSTRLISGT